MISVGGYFLQRVSVETQVAQFTNELQLQDQSQQQEARANTSKVHWYVSGDNLTITNGGSQMLIGLQKVFILGNSSKSEVMQLSIPPCSVSVFNEDPSEFLSDLQFLDLEGAWDISVTGGLGPMTDAQSKQYENAVKDSMTLVGSSKDLKSVTHLAPC